MNNIFNHLPPSWRVLLVEELDKNYVKNLNEFFQREREDHQVFPPENLLFEALRLSPPNKTRVLILGQDPYHGPGQAHGLSFSVPAGNKFPPSLRNIFKELKNDLDIDPPLFGDLSAWALQGVLLLNSVLSVRAHQAASHQNKGWEKFSDAIIEKLSQKYSNIIFILWGSFAQKKAALIDPAKHFIISSAHPSPLSAHRGFFGSKPFSRCNDQLLAWQQKPIDWNINA